MLYLLNTIEQAKGKEKLSIIRENDSRLLRLLFRYAYSPKIVFGIKDFTLPPSEPTTQLTADTLHLTLEALINSKTPQLTIDALLSGYATDDQEVISRIIKKDLRVGVSAKSFNKAIGDDYVYTHPYNRCSSLNEKTAKKISFPCYSQVKSDGKFADLMIESHSPIHDGLEQPMVRFCNRDGVTMPILPQNTLDAISELRGFVGDVAISGELLYLNEDNTVAPREVGNGALNSDEIDPERVLFRVWDIRGIPSDNTGYQDRLDLLDMWIDALSPLMNIELTPTVVCNDWDDVGAHYKKCRMAGEEGTIVKNIDFKFKDGTSPDCIKLKSIIEGDVRVVGITEGEKKWTGVGIGALLIESECGQMKCSTAGLTDKQRVDWYNKPELIVGKVIRVLFNSIVQRDGEDTMALYLPRFDEVRDDKHVADTLERLLEQEAASIEVLTTWE